MRSKEDPYLISAENWPRLRVRVWATCAAWGVQAFLLFPWHQTPCRVLSVWAEGVNILCVCVCVCLWTKTLALQV